MQYHLQKQTMFENFENIDQKFIQHFHDTYAIGITHNGMFQSNIHGKNTYFYAKYTRVVNPSETHGGEGHDWACTNFYPTVDTLSDIYQQIFYEKKVPIFKNHIMNDEKMYQHFYTFFYSVYHNDDHMQIETNKILALSHLIRNHTHHTKNIDMKMYTSDIINESIIYINDMINDPISLDDLAKSVSLSKYHFLRLFKHYTGVTPHNYILAKRVQHATSMIISGSTIAEASHFIGFSDQSHFTRSFKKVYGYTPSYIHKKSNIILYR